MLDSLVVNGERTCQVNAMNVRRNIKADKTIFLCYWVKTGKCFSLRMSQN